MSTNITRRNALKASLGVSAGLLIPSTLVKAANLPLPAVGKEYASIAKHGNTKKEDLMLWSLLEVPDTTRLQKLVDDYRVAYRYKSRIKYSSNDRYKVEICKYLIDAISADTSVNFNMVIFEKYASVIEGASPSKVDERLVSFYKQLSSKVSGDIIVKSSDAFGHSQEFVDSVSLTSGNTLITKRVYDDDLIQVNELISGIVFALYRVDQVRSKHKVEIIEHFKNVYKTDGSIKEGRLGNNINIIKGKV